MSVVRQQRRQAQREHIELVMQAHDRLHADDVDGCHGFIHAVLGVGPVPSTGVSPLAPGLPFDHAFRDLCVKFNVKAAYVSIEPTGVVGRGRVCAGGDSDVCSMVRGAIERNLE